MIRHLDFARDTLEAIHLLQKERLHLQLMVIFYSAIDTMGWLATEDEWASGESFRNWLDAYLLPRSGLTCTAEDLWGARNALLHTGTAESRHTRSGAAREIWYHSNEAAGTRLKEIVAAHPNVIAVNLTDLIAAFAPAMEAFTVHINADPALAERVDTRTKNWLHWVGPGDQKSRQPNQRL